MTLKNTHDLLTPVEASREINRSISTLAKDRMNAAAGNRCRGPQHVLVGGRIYYRRVDLKKWVDNQIAESLGNVA